MSIVKTIDHISIVVKELELAVRHFTQLLGGEVLFTRDIEKLGVRMAFIRLGDRLISIEQPTRPGPFADVLAKRGEGVHHIGLSVHSLGEARERLVKLGIKGVNETADDEREELLIMPRDGLGILWQLIEWKGPCGDSFENRLAYSRRSLYR
ncbi:MAG: hypothetical protein GXX09_01070 [Syntrophomonadaceae bacterium]|nr:hypothetical protein [Syntrophomonadaceae bacterium]